MFFFLGGGGRGQGGFLNRKFFKEKGRLRDKNCLSLEFLQGLCVLF